MDDFNEDGLGDGEPGVQVWADEVVQDLAGIIVGIDAEHQENGPDSLLSTDQGKVARAYLEVWLNALVEDNGDVISDKTTVGELLLFLSNVQAEMDLGSSGGHIN